MDRLQSFLACSSRASCDAALKSKDFLALFCRIDTVTGLRPIPKLSSDYRWSPVAFALGLQVFNFCACTSWLAVQDHVHANDNWDRIGSDLDGTCRVHRVAGDCATWLHKARELQA